jgi:hypothetical protein
MSRTMRLEPQVLVHKVESNGQQARAEISSFFRRELRYYPIPRIKDGVLAQLVERLNGIEEVRGSNPLGSTFYYWS